MRYWCGPFYFPNWLKKWLSKRFNYACCLHDTAYSEKNLDRKTVDKRFLQRMLRVSQTRKDKIIAHVYYGLVRVFGWISWKLAK